MATSGGVKITTLKKIAPGASKAAHWNNANAESYSLNAWPQVSAGVTGSAEITKVAYKVHGSPSERELHFTVKNTGKTTIDVDVWAFWFNA